MYQKWRILLAPGIDDEFGHPVEVQAHGFEVVDGAATFYGPTRVRDRKRIRDIEAVYAPGTWLWVKES